MKFVTNIIFSSLLLGCLLVVWPGQGVYAQEGEGVRLLAPDLDENGIPDQEDLIMLQIVGTDNAFGEFAKFNPGTDDDNRLLISTKDASEVINIGLSQRATRNGNDNNEDYFFLIRDLSNRDVVHGPFRIRVDSQNVNSWAEAEFGQYEISRTLPIYQDSGDDIPTTIIPGSTGTPYLFAPGKAGTFSIEFIGIDDGGLNQVRRAFYLPYWNFTVVNGDDEVQTGRLWSRNWVLRTPNLATDIATFCFWDRPFGGDFYSYTADSLTTRVDFAGTNMRGLSFNVAFNSTGPGTTGDLLEDRRSLPDVNATLNVAEHQIFLSPPDPELFLTETGECATVEVLEEALTCVDGSFCIPIRVSAPGQVELSWLRPQGEALPIGLADYPRSVFPANGPLDTCIAISAIDSIGGDVSSLRLQITYSRGAQHWAAYDVELIDKGFCVTTDLPESCLNIPGFISGDGRLYWDDTKFNSLPGGMGLRQSPVGGASCENALRSWNEFDINQPDCVNFDDDATSGYGDRSTINTWWFAYRQELDIIELPIPSIAIIGPDTLCTDVDVVYRADASGFEDGEVLTYSWTGPNGISGDEETILATEAGEYCVTVTNETGCERSNCKTLVIGVGATPDVSLPAPEVLVCTGEEVILSVINNDPNQTLTYEWLPENAFVDNTLAMPDYLEDQGGQEVTVQVRSLESGCDTLLTVNVAFREGPDLEASVIFDDVCTPVDTLRATVSDGTTVEWLDADDNVVGTGLTLVTNTGPGAFTFTARATDANCNEVVLSDPLTVRFEPVDISAAGPTDPVCVGDEVVLSVTNDDSPRDTLTYVWTPANAFVDNTLAMPDYLEGMGSQMVTVTATNQFGCEDTRTLDITILDSIELEASVIFDDVCTPVDTLRATVSPSLTVEWLDEDGNVVGTGLTLVTNTGPGASIFTARVTDEDCNLTVLSDPLTVNFEPVDISVTGPTGPVCVGDEVMLSVINDDSPNDVLTYVWTPADAFVDNTLAMPDYLEGMGDQTVTVTATNQFGCEDTRTLDITILDSIELEASVIFDDVCTPVDTLRATVTDGLTVEWLDEDGNVVGTGLTLVTNTGPGASIFTARVTDEDCNLTVLSDPLTVNFEPVDITVTGPTGPVCAGDEVMLSVTNDDSPNDVLTYVWTPADAFVDNTLAMPDYLEGMGDQTVTVTATNQFGCEDTRTIDIMILDSIELEASVIFDDVCTPVDTLRATVSDGLTVEWIDEDGNVVGTGLTLVTNTGPGASIFTARVTDEDCDIVVLSDPLTVNFEPVDITATGPTGPVCAGDEVMLSVTNDDSPNDVLTYVWTPADAFVDNTLAMPDYLEGMGDQTVTVTATNQFGCEDMRTFDIMIIDSIELTASVIFDDVCTPVDTLRATLTGDAMVEWLDEDGNVVGTGLELITNTGEGTSTFTARATNDACDQVILSEPLTVSFEPVDVSIEEVCLPNSFELSAINNDPNDDLTFVWSPADAFVDNTLAMPDYLENQGQQTVTVTATNQFGCTATASLDISCPPPTACDPDAVYIPNFFTPNGDNSNDVVRLRSPFLEELLEVELMIYNRWGEEIFRTTDKFAQWDGSFKGEQLAPDVYGFWLRYVCPDGEAITEKGNITLMR